MVDKWTDAAREDQSDMHIPGSTTAQSVITEFD
jgi:hypothetical protein